MHGLILTAEDRANMNIALQHCPVREEYLAHMRAVPKHIHCFAKNRDALNKKSLRIEVGVVGFAGYTPLQQREKKPE